MRVSAALMTLVAGLAPAGCNDTAAPMAAVEQAGVLQLIGYDGPRTVIVDETVEWSVTPDEDVLAPAPVIMVPDSVDAGAPFEIAVTTIGLSGCWRAEHQRVRVRSGVVEMTPRDVHSGAEVCTGVVLYLTHVSTVTLDEPGDWIIRVEGRRMRYGDHVWEEPVSAQKTIVVR